MRLRSARLLAGLLFLCISWPVRADYLYSVDYTEAAQAVLARRYVDARGLADRMLESDPDSFEAHAVLGQVHLRGEEDLGLAQFHLNRARALLERRFPPPLGQAGPRALHQEILRNLRQTAYLREQYQHSLELLSEYNALYDPDLDHLRGWPLLKLGRFQEAKVAVETAQAKLDPEDPGQVDLWDTLGQLAYEQNLLQEATQRFLSASSLETDTADQPDPVYLTNLGEVYRDQLRFAEAETCWLEAAGWSHPGTYAEPHQRLACLYAGSARWEEALTQLELSVAWRAGLWPQVAAHTRASHLTSVGEVMLAVGESEAAVRVLRRALASPNRQALSSGRTSVALAKRYTLYAAALDLRAAKAWEEQSWATGRAWWAAGQRAAESSVLAAWARSQATVMLAQGGLREALAPYGPGAMQCPWLLPEVAAGLGQGPTGLALRKLPSPAPQTGAPSNSAPEPSPGESSTGSLQAYLPYRSLLQTDADAMLPEPETLARAALLARQGTRWEEALRLDPEVARREGLSMGISVSGSTELADLLEGSPRFHSGKDLTISVSPDRSAVVSGPQGAELARTGPNPDLPSLAAELHANLFSNQTGWSPTRLEALTREASPGRMASARLEGLLGRE